MHIVGLCEEVFWNERVSMTRGALVVFKTGVKPMIGVTPGVSLQVYRQISIPTWFRTCFEGIIGASLWMWTITKRFQTKRIGFTMHILSRLVLLAERVIDDPFDTFLPSMDTRSLYMSLRSNEYFLLRCSLEFLYLISFRTNALPLQLPQLSFEPLVS
jgi:hypothetical protein